MIQNHSVPRELFDEIAAAGSSPRAVSLLRRTILSRNLQLITRLVGERSELLDAAELLSRVQQVAPAVAESVLTYPWVSNYLISSVRLAPGERSCDYLRAIAVACAGRAGIHHTIQIARNRPVALPTLGILPLCQDPMSLDGLVPLTVLGAENPDHPRIYIDDLDPYRDCHGYSLHDGMEGSAAFEWEHVVQEGLDLLMRTAPDRVEELRLVELAIAPLDRERTPIGVSVTSSDSFGGFAATVSNSPVEFAVTLIHEFHHSKLNALHGLLPLFDVNDDGRFFAPWRADPRPIGGLLHGAFAFTAVADLWLRWREDSGSAKQAMTSFAVLRAQIRRVIPDLLTANGLTEHGRLLVPILAETVEGFDAVRVPSAIERNAQRVLNDLEDRWVSRER